MGFYKFFEFLEKKKGKNIPILVKLAHNPENVSDNEFKNIGSDNVAKILRYYPYLRDKVDIGELTGDAISWFLVMRPETESELINKFDFNKLNGYDVATVLRYRPQFIDRFDLSKLNGNDICWILQHQPKLIDKFDLNKLNTFDKWEIAEILQKQPQLRKYFKEHGLL